MITVKKILVLQKVVIPSRVDYSTQLKKDDILHIIEKKTADVLFSIKMTYIYDRRWQIWHQQLRDFIIREHVEHDAL